MTAQPTFFSIVIPTYNRGDILNETLQSILAQQYDSFEVIIVDDGGNDNTKEIVDAFKNNKLKYFWKENGERGAARNFGMQKARGDYFFFLDSDDHIKPGYLSYANELIQINDGAGAIHIPYNTLLNGIEITNPPLPKDIDKKIFVQNRFACQVIIKRDVALATVFSENRDFCIGEDWYYIIKIAITNKFIIGTKNLGLIVQHSTRSMHTISPEKVIISRDIFVSLLKEIETLPAFIIKNVEYELTNLAALQAVLQAQKLPALKFLFQSVVMRPLRTFRVRNFAIIKKVLFY